MKCGTLPRDKRCWLGENLRMPSAGGRYGCAAKAARPMQAVRQPPADVLLFSANCASNPAPLSPIRAAKCRAEALSDRANAFSLPVPPPGIRHTIAASQFVPVSDCIAINYVFNDKTRPDGMVPANECFTMKKNPLDEIAWFCLKSQPKREHIAAAHLRQMPEVEAFSPRLRFQRPTTRGARWFEESMFPGYLFARFQFLDRYTEVRSASGVSRIVAFGGQYATIDDSVIEMLRAKTGDSGVTVVNSEIKAGDTVRIVGGSLGGLDAVVTQVLSGRERVRLLLNFLGREVHAEVNTNAVLPAKRHPLLA